VTARTRSTWVIITSTLSWYTFAGWVYIAENAVVHPRTLGLRLTHLAPWPHEDTFGVVCFAVSFACALISRLLKASYHPTTPLPGDGR